MACCGDQDKTRKQLTEASAVEGKCVESNGNCVERLKHPLAHTWSWWLYRDTGRHWGSNLVEITTFSTVEDFWCLYHHTKLPSELEYGQYSVFKEGVRPEWEHPANKKGGRLLITLERRHMHEVDRLWTDMVLLMIGENFEDANNEVCGAVVNVNAKNNKCKLALWITNIKSVENIKVIGKKLRTLNLPCNIHFHGHESTRVIFNM